MDETRRRSSLVVLVVPVSSLQVRLAQNLPASQCGLGGTLGGPWPGVIGRLPVVAKLGVAFDTKPAPNTNEAVKQCGWGLRGSAGRERGHFFLSRSLLPDRDASPEAMDTPGASILWILDDIPLPSVPDAGRLSSTGSLAVIQGHCKFVFQLRESLSHRVQLSCYEAKPLTASAQTCLASYLEPLAAGAKPSRPQSPDDSHPIP